MRSIWGIVAVVIGALVIAVGVSFLWAIVASWCLVGLWACLSMAGVMLPFTLSWSWWLVLALWLLSIIIAFLFNGLRVRTSKD